MPTLTDEDLSKKVKPLCPVFGECGGCLYQDLPYPEELSLKQKLLSGILEQKVDLNKASFREIIPSPKPYHYRNRLDLKLLKTKDNKVFIGFSPQSKNKVVPINECPIAIEAISDFIPELKNQAVERLTPKYRNANLTIRTGDDKRVLWGGIGKRSLELSPDHYLSTKIGSKTIFYSLDTFFQANLSILPELLRILSSFTFIKQESTFFDLYGGVGLFGINLNDKVKNVILIEDCIQSIRVAEHNSFFNGLKNLDIYKGKVEGLFPELLKNSAGPNIVMIDPPRSGLSKEALKLLSNSSGIDNLIYLSCNPKALADDLKYLCEYSFNISEIIPFDLFPKTEHIETLVTLEKKHGRTNYAAS
ncbi:MAG: class I SAM-dependent RNA methyltransferase [Candidatus Omnitrophica bacterium]|nr:class I SAM-dependent RNA methyltransferase [Candidatus Omnitrophota bacterium]